jgi:hypothetical protein
MKVNEGKKNDFFYGSNLDTKETLPDWWSIGERVKICHHHSTTPSLQSPPSSITHWLWKIGEGAMTRFAFYILHSCRL